MGPRRWWRGRRVVSDDEEAGKEEEKGVGGGSIVGAGVDGVGAGAAAAEASAEVLSEREVCAVVGFAVVTAFAEELGDKVNVVASGALDDDGVEVEAAGTAVCRSKALPPLNPFVPPSSVAATVLRACCPVSCVFTTA